MVEKEWGGEMWQTGSRKRGIAITEKLKVCSIKKLLKQKQVFTHKFFKRPLTEIYTRFLNGTGQGKRDIKNV